VYIVILSTVREEDDLMTIMKRTGHVSYYRIIYLPGNENKLHRAADRRRHTGISFRKLGTKYNEQLRP
jgi:hypothetical protein